MECYNHSGTNAVGICKSCNKGVCKACSVEIGNGLACLNSCEEDVKQLNSIINKSNSSYTTAAGAHMRNAYMLGIMGTCFLGFGFITDALFGFMTVMGIVFLFSAGLSYISARKYKNNVK